MKPWTFGSLDPAPKLKRGRVRNLTLAKKACIVLALCSAAAASAAAQTLNTLVSFDGTNGSNPFSVLVQGTDGNFYGTTETGGAHGGGTIFRITTAGKLATLYSFCSQANCTDGQSPVAGLVQATNGHFYGTTAYGGANSSACSSGCGSVFEIGTGGKLITLHSFDGADGARPSGLIQGINGNFYGTTSQGGDNNACSSVGCGTVFRISTVGGLITLYNFCSEPGCTDGWDPFDTLLQEANGNLYGTTFEGGTSGVGTFFQITLLGKLTTLHSFDFGGANPSGGLVKGVDGSFYGATSFSSTGAGTVFKITSAGSLTTLYSFCTQYPLPCTDGANPEGPLVQATDGNFYGITGGGGTSESKCLDVNGGCGTIFKVTSGGNITTVHSFDVTDGDYPLPLIQATDGNFYGTALDGGSSVACGSYRCGTVFSLAVGLGPFVETRPTFAKVGTGVVILGNSLIGTTGVSFNGTTAGFKVISKSEIKTTVPVGSTTGTVLVTTPSGTLKSNVVFQVKP